MYSTGPHTITECRVYALPGEFTHPQVRNIAFKLGDRISAALSAHGIKSTYADTASRNFPLSAGTVIIVEARSVEVNSFRSTATGATTEPFPTGISTHNVAVFDGATGKAIADFDLKVRTGLSNLKSADGGFDDAARDFVSTCIDQSGRLVARAQTVRPAKRVKTSVEIHSLQGNRHLQAPAASWAIVPLASVISKTSSAFGAPPTGPGHVDATHAENLARGLLEFLSAQQVQAAVVAPDRQHEITPEFFDRAIVLTYTGGHTAHQTERQIYGVSVQRVADSAARFTAKLMVNSQVAGAGMQAGETDWPEVAREFFAAIEGLSGQSTSGMALEPDASTPGLPHITITAPSSNQAIDDLLTRSIVLRPASSFGNVPTFAPTRNAREGDGDARMQELHARVCDALTAALDRQREVAGNASANGTATASARDIAVTVKLISGKWAEQTAYWNEAKFLFEVRYVGKPSVLASYHIAVTGMQPSTVLASSLVRTWLSALRPREIKRPDVARN